jgi:hypothetical protein
VNNMHAKMQIYAEILRQIGRMPNDYKEPDMEEMEEMEEPEEEEDKGSEDEARMNGKKK